MECLVGGELIRAPSAPTVRGNYCRVDESGLSHPYDSEAPDTLTRFVHGSFRALVLNEQFACVGGGAAVRQNTYRFGLYDVLGDDASSAELACDLGRFINDADLKGKPLTAFAASFRGPLPADERQFEDLLWQTLQQVSHRDGAPWAGGRHSDPREPTFTFSFGGTSLFVVGLHAASSRLTRRFAWPTLIFNPHDQFDRFRQDGTYGRLRDVIRARDVALQGTTNPMLTDFGEESEARQYSGRRVDENWTCPFHAAVPNRSPRGTE